jgi:hypothetical protein
MKASIREKKILTLAEVTSLLGSGITGRCLRIGWLRPCAEEKSLTKPAKVYSMRLVEEIENRIQCGNYPIEIENGRSPK